MATAKKPEQSRDDTGPACPPAGKVPVVVVVFLSIVVTMLAADLVVKSISFERVAGAPVVLTDENSADPEVVPPHPPINLVPYVLSLKLTVNRGAVFGIGQGQKWMFIIISLIAVGVIGRVFWKSESNRRWFHVCLALILSGALGNLYDRMLFGAVRDMLWLFPDVKLPFGWTWGNGSDEIYPWIFNIADVALVVGVTVMIFVMWRYDKQKQIAESTPD